MATSWVFLVIVAAVTVFDGALCLSRLSRCQNGYQELGDDLCVKRYDTKTTWSLAREHCIREKGDLLTLENEKINELFKKSPIATNGWMGLNKINTVPHFVWLDDHTNTVPVPNHKPCDKEASKAESEQGYSDFLGQYDPDYALANCGLFHSQEYSHDLKGWKSAICVERHSYFCAYTSLDDFSPVLVPFADRKLKCADDSWTLSEGNCYKVFTKKAVTFEDARTACYEQGADLAEIHNDKQTHAVKNLLGKKKASYWIGAMEVATKNVFEFVGGRPIPKNSPWRKGKPNKSAKNDEDCVEMAQDGYWSDKKCDSLSNYVCGTKAKEISPCKKGFYLIGDDLCVRLHDTKQTYYVARQICKSQGNDLLVIKDEQTNKMFKETVKKVGLTSGWIGLNRINSSPSYVWLDGNKQLVTFTDFVAGDDKVSKEKKCVHVTEKGKTIGWETSGCTKRFKFFSSYSKSDKDSPAPPPTPEKDTDYKYECPDETWTLADKTCIKAFSDKAKNYADARKDVATKYGGDLVEIDNVEMNKEVTGLLAGKTSWIGTSDLEREGVYETVSGKPLPRKFYPWSRGEPNGGKAESCMVTYPNGKWNDLYCTYRSYWVGQVKASKACAANCLNMKVSPAKAVEVIDKEVTIRFDASSLVDAAKIVSMAMHKTDSVFDSAVTLTPGDFIANGLEMNKKIKTRGHIDAKNPTKSFLSTVFTKPMEDLSGTYRCRVVYVDKSGYLRTKEVSSKLQVDACQTGYTFVGEMCVKYHTKPENYFVARETCKGEGNDLVVIKDVKSDNAFKEFITKKGGKPAVWIGLNRIDSNPHFVWLDRTSELATYPGFIAGKIRKNLLQKCGYLTKDKNGRFGWKSAECTDRLPFCSGYIRSEKAKPTPPVTEKDVKYECPDKTWTLADKTCIKAFSDDHPKPFAEARKEVATKYGGDLVEIDNADINKKVQHLLKEGKTYWIGAVDMGKTGTFEYIRSGKPLPAKKVFNPWQPSAPGPGNGVDVVENCVECGEAGNLNCVDLKKGGMWKERYCGFRRNWVAQIKARQLCKDCLTLTINPTKVSEMDEDPITIKCDARGLNDDVTRIMAMSLYRTDSVSGGIYLYPGNHVVTNNPWSKDIKAKGHVDIKAPATSYLTATLMTPDLALAGNYRCVVIYVNKQSVTKIVETSSELAVEPTTVDTLLVHAKKIYKNLNDKNKDIEEIKKSLIKREKKLVEICDRKVVDVKKVIEVSQSTCCPSLASLITSQGKQLARLDNILGKWPTISVNCPAGWMRLPGTETCIKAFDQKRNFDEARLICQNNGGDLVQIRNGDENYAVTRVLNMIGGNKDIHAWIGITDKQKEGKFKLLDGESLTYGNFKKGEPNDSWNKEDCLHTMKSGQWNDGWCQSQIGFVCQIPEIGSLVPYCGKGWALNKFTKTCMMYYMDKRTFGGARQSCKAHKADLIRLDTEDKQEFFNNLHTSKQNKVWIGLCWSKRNNLWHWLSDTTKTPYVSWYKSEPTNKVASGCVTTQGKSASWSGESCSATFPYVCEQAAKMVPFVYNPKWPQFN